MSLIDDLASAIARYEGYNNPANLAARNNNPGNLRSWGSYPVVNGYVQFPDAATGWAALRRQVQLNIDRGLTLQEFFGGKPGVYSGYAPAADGNRPATYAQTVAGWLGISTGQRLADLANRPGADPQPAPAWNGPILPALEFPGLNDDPADWLPYAAAAIAVASLLYLFVFRSS
jgi:hypothetical protein